jgi:Phasin protein
MGRKTSMTQLSTVGRETPKIPDFNPEVIAEVTTPVLAAATSFQQGFIQNVMAYQKEWLSFLNTRVQENMAMPARLSGCRSFPEVQQVYMDYCKRTLEQYSRESQSLREIAAASEQLGGPLGAATTKPAGTVSTPSSETLSARVRLDS